MYKCINPFKSHKGRKFDYGDRIGSGEYYDLHYDERRHFEDDSSVSTSGSSSASIFPDNNYNGVPDIIETPSYDNTPSYDPTPDTSSSDFGGGDFGGGGAGGEW